MINYKEINNLQIYVEDLIKNGSEVILAEKTARIKARPGVEGEKVVSWTEGANGEAVLEKEAKVTLDTDGIPDWVATKVDASGKEMIDRNGNINQWIIRNQTFQKKYVEDVEQSGIFKPVGGIQKFLKLKEAVHVVQWGEEWNIDAGGYVNISVAVDYYVISERDFHDTYYIIY